MTDPKDGAFFHEEYVRRTSSPAGAQPPSFLEGNSTAQVKTMVNALEARIDDLEKRLGYVSDVCGALLKRATEGNKPPLVPDPLAEALRTPPPPAPLELPAPEGS